MDGDGCKLKVGEDYGRYADWVEGMEPGVYQVGMDTHVGFIVNRADGMHFLHSSGWKKRGVVDEPRKYAGALRHSNWRMLGGLTMDPAVIRTWLRGETIRVHQ